MMYKAYSHGEQHVNLTESRSSDAVVFLSSGRVTLTMSMMKPVAAAAATKSASFNPLENAPGSSMSLHAIVPSSECSASMENPEIVAPWSAGTGENSTA